jgi:hypothetical protein
VLTVRLLRGGSAQVASARTRLSGTTTVFLRAKHKLLCGGYVVTAELVPSDGASVRFQHTAATCVQTKSAER